MDTLRFLWGPHPPPVAGSAALDARQQQHHHPPFQVAAAALRSPATAPDGDTAAVPPRLSYMTHRPLRRIWPGGDGDLTVPEKATNDAIADTGRPSGNWVMNILRVRSLWTPEEKEKTGGDGAPDGEEEEEEEDEEEEGGGSRCAGCGEGSEGCPAEGGAAEAVDRESFSRLLRRVSLAEAELYAKLSYLSNLAYTIPKIKPVNLLKYHGLHFVTSSIEKKAKILSSEDTLDQEKVPDEKTGDTEEGKKQKEGGNGINLLTAYHIAASGASYLQSQTKGILPFRSKKPDISKKSPEGSSEVQCKITSSEVASFMATTNSVTAMVAGKEEMKQAVAEDLNSPQSSPSEWFICDEVNSSTRCFVIQGSDSLASWQANLLFEPIQFEGLDVLVHRGIYEAAKGIYQQMLPEIQYHLMSRRNATLRFTGHSLGGSLALLINLMLLIRGDAPSSSLLPVITFGAPSVMCGGDYLLQKLGLPQSHVQAITMHRDIVPRAFSCNYPDHVAKILTTINGKFRNHPCLKNQKMLYAPMGKLLILQPEEKFSPHHHLLPPGSGLYLLGHSFADYDDSMKQLQAAQYAFINSPHPLEVLSDRAAYGSEGTVYRDHDMNAYLRSLRGVIRQELKLVRKAKREVRRLLWWPLVSPQGVHSDVIVGQYPRLTNTSPHKFSFGGVFHGGKETLKRFRRMVTSQHVHMLIVILVPARILLLGTLSFVKF